MMKKERRTTNYWQNNGAIRNMENSYILWIYRSRNWLEIVETSFHIYCLLLWEGWACVRCHHCSLKIIFNFPKQNISRRESKKTRRVFVFQFQWFFNDHWKWFCSFLLCLHGIRDHKCTRKNPFICAKFIGHEEKVMHTERNFKNQTNGCDGPSRIVIYRKRINFSSCASLGHFNLTIKLTTNKRNFFSHLKKSKVKI